MFRIIATFTASVVLSLGATVPAQADLVVSPGTTGSGSILSTGSYGCPTQNLGPGVLRLCPDIISSSGKVTLTAVPKADPPGHWRFVRWDGFGCGSTATCTIETLDGYFFPIAVFEDPVAPTITPTVEHSTTRDRTVTLSWTANEWASVTCAVDGTPLPECPSSQAVTLPEGSHTFTARGSDLSENLSSPVQKAFRILDTVLVSGPPSSSNSKTAAFTVSTGLGTRFDCALDNRYLGTCAPKGADGTGTVTLSNLAEGEHTMRIYAVDGQDADYVPVTRTWTVDTIAPNVTLTAGADATFSFTSNEPSARFECRLDSDDFTPCMTGLKPSLSAGEHRIAVRAIDRAGNVSATATHTWSIAGPPPVIQAPVVQPPQRSVKPAEISTIAGKRKVSTKRLVDIATITCPAGATCAITAPKTATVTIAHKRYTVTVTKTKTRVSLKLTATAYAKLKGRTGSVKVTIGATATGAPTTTLIVSATLRR